MYVQLLALLLASAAIVPLAAASHTGCSPNGFGYTCHVNVGPYCSEWEIRVGQSSTARECTDWREILP